MPEHEKTLVISDTRQLHSASTRRGFLRALGLGGTVVLLPSAFAACRESTSPRADADVAAQVNAQQAVRAVTIDLSTDVGIFQFATVLEQLEQAFYAQLTGSSAFNALFPAEIDREAIVDIRNDEFVHRAFIDRALGGAALPQLAFDFTGVFTSRQTVLTAARAFANTGVAAYNGAGQFLKSATNLAISGKIVSIEGRHSATLLDLDDAANATGAGESTGVRFADLSQTLLVGLGADNANALDNVRTFTQVAAIADPYVATTVTLANAPA